MSKTTYRLVEIFDLAPGEERDYTTEAAARAALAQAVEDLVAEGFTVTSQTEDSARLQIDAPEEGGLVKVRFLIAEVQPLRTVEVPEDCTFEDFCALLERDEPTF